MKKSFLIVGSLLMANYFSQAQVQKEKLNKTEVELVYNQYIQDGNNSAVTGGIGTEKLTVNGPILNIKKTYSKSSLSTTLGADIVTSASTDNIDYIVSSASRRDIRAFANVTYEKRFEKKNLAVYGGLGFSIESDYLSLGSKLGFSKESKNKIFGFSGQLQVFNDDLRWGRLHRANFKPIRLIYPSELRYKEWHDEVKRNSYNLKLGFTQVLNRRNIIGVFPEITYQEGLLATPFHRVYFSDGNLGVERFPNERWKQALAVRLNSFLGDNVVLKNIVNGYHDNFGITAFSLENETAIKLKNGMTLLPNARFYTQKGSDFFAKYKLHDVSASFFTSDFDYSSFQSYNVGIGLKHVPYRATYKQIQLNSFIFRYNYMYRSNNLSAHVLSLAIKTEWAKKFKRISK